MIAWIKKEKSFLAIILGILIFRGSIINWYRVPSESMVPTLQVGDYIVVNRLAFGIHIPFTQISLLKTGNVGRGDIVVFDWPPDPSILYVKRIIGLPGDKLKIADGKVFINGEQLCIPNCEVYSAGDFDMTVPEGSYWAMGDNRPNSSDSRVWGFVPFENIRGRAKFVALSVKLSDNYLPSFNWSRTFQGLNSSFDFLPKK